MWFHHETWKLWLHFSFGDAGFAPGPAPRGEGVNPGCVSGMERSGAASEMEEIRIAAKRIFHVRVTQPFSQGSADKAAGALARSGAANSSFAFSLALISTLATYHPCILLTVQRLGVSSPEQCPPSARIPRRGDDVPLPSPVPVG